MSPTALHGRRIAITGAGRGIGLATAKSLHQQGATIVIGDLDIETATAAADIVGPGTHAYPVDVSNYESFAAFHKQATADAPLDVLINNAGIMPIGGFLEQSADTHRRAVEINVMGCINGMQLALPAMTERGSGHIINIASSAGKTPVPGGLTYCGTKAAVIALTETARVEFAGTGVRVNCVMPTFTNTELIVGTNAQGATKPVQPEDIAAAVIATLDKPKTIVSVPYPLRFMAIGIALLPPRARRWVSKAMGTDRVFLDLDNTARASYERRARAATGLIETSEKP